MATEPKKINESLAAGGKKQTNEGGKMEQWNSNRNENAIEGASANW